MAQSLLHHQQCGVASTIHNHVGQKRGCAGSLSGNNGFALLVKPPQSQLRSRRHPLVGSQQYAHFRVSASIIPPYRERNGDGTPGLKHCVKSSAANRFLQTVVSGALATALVLLPADGSKATEAYEPFNANPTVAVAAVEEKVQTDAGADLFSQLRGYGSAAEEGAQRGEAAALSKPGGEDLVTAAVESVRIAEDLDVTKLPEIHGPAEVSKKNISKAPEAAPATENVPKPAEAPESEAGGLVERLKSGGSKLAGSLNTSKQLLSGGGAKVREFVGRIKDGVTGKEQRAPQALVESQATPAITGESPGGVKGWFDNLTGGRFSESGKDSEKEAQGGGLFGGGSQAGQPQAKSKGLIRSFLQPKPPKEEKTGLAAAWESFTSLDFLPDNVRDGALTVKNVLSVILTVLSLVLSIFSKALGLAADLIGIIARGL